MPPFGTAVILYMLFRDPHRAEQVLQELRNLALNKKEEIMNALQQRSNEGMQTEIAKSMLKDGEPLHRIMQWTGLKSNSTPGTAITKPLRSLPLAKPCPETRGQ